MITVHELQKKIHRWGIEKGWTDDRSIGELLLLAISELTEAFEEIRNGRAPNETWYSTDASGNQKPEGVPSEIADCVIRLLHLCAWHGINLEAAIQEKHEYNKTRSWRHGGKKA